MSRCAQCSNFSLKGQTAAQHGLYTCKVLPTYVYPNPFMERECGSFRQVPETEAEARAKFEAAR